MNCSIAVVLCTVHFSAATSERVVSLDRWHDRAALVPNPGPGYEVFRLVAEATWDRNAPRDPSRYALRVTLPDGQATTQQLVFGEGPPHRTLTVYVPTSAVLNRLPRDVRVRVSVVDSATGGLFCDELEATIADFPNPGAGRSAESVRPFGWGDPLNPSTTTNVLPNAGPDGFQFARVKLDDAGSAYFLSLAEATNRQVKTRLPDYDPKAGRSDEFNLEDPAQPALNLTPKRAEAFLESLTKADASGIHYRLPTAAEWTLAALAGKKTAFWWGDEPSHPEGANLLGPEPALATDSTAVAEETSTSPAFKPNPWKFMHTFGNVAEWVVQEKGHARAGGHFRTEPASPLAAVAVENAGAIGPDPYVGVRPAFSLDAAEGARLVRNALGKEPFWSGVDVTFDPLSATARVTGAAPNDAARRLADDRTHSLWWLAALENQLVVPEVPASRLATLGAVAGPIERTRPLGRVIDNVPISVSWVEELPVEGSTWYVNIDSPSGGHASYRLPRAGRDTSKIVVPLDRSVFPSNDGVVSLSLGEPAVGPGDPRIVSNAAPLLAPQAPSKTGR